MYRRKMCSLLLSVGILAFVGCCDRGAKVEAERAWAEAAQAQVEAKKARAELERVKADAEHARAEVAQAQAEAEKARAELERVMVAYTLPKIERIKKILSQYGEINLITETRGGRTFWTNLRSRNGWKLQKNRITNHCRILDPDNWRYAWGNEREMQGAWDATQHLFD